MINYYQRQTDMDPTEGNAFYFENKRANAFALVRIRPANLMFYILSNEYFMDAREILQ